MHTISLKKNLVNKHVRYSGRPCRVFSFQGYIIEHDRKSISDFFLLDHEFIKIFKVDPLFDYDQDTKWRLSEPNG